MPSNNRRSERRRSTRACRLTSGIQETAGGSRAAGTEAVAVPAAPDAGCETG